MPCPYMTNQLILPRKPHAANILATGHRTFVPSSQRIMFQCVASEIAGAGESFVASWASVAEGCGGGWDEVRGRGGEDRSQGV